MMSLHVHAALAADRAHELQRAGACGARAAPVRLHVLALARRQPRDCLIADTCAAPAVR
jgi:hypothetical protein